MKTRKIFSILCVAMVIFILSSNAMEVMAATYGTKASSGTYTQKGYKNVGTYRHVISKHSSNWVLFYPNKRVTNTIYHVYGHGDDVLSYSKSVSLSYTKTTNWSVNASITAKCSFELASVFSAGVDAAVGMGYGSSYALGISYTSSSNVSKTIKDTAPTAYYTRVPGYTFYKIKDVATRMGRLIGDTFYFDVPYGLPVLYTIYSKDNANWSIY